MKLLLLRHGEHSAVHGVWGDWSGEISDTLSYPVYEPLRQEPIKGRRVFGFKAYGLVSARIGTEAVQLNTELVSGDFYAEMGLRPVVGRPIEPTDDRLGAPSVAVISYAMWQGSFGGVPDVVGKQIYLGGVPVTVVGVNPPSYRGATGALESPEMDVPVSMMRVLRPNAGKDDPLASTELWWLNAMMRVEEPSAFEQDAVVLGTESEGAFRATSKIAAGETVPKLLFEDGS